MIQDGAFTQAILAVLKHRRKCGLLLSGSLAAGKEGMETDLGLAMDAGRLLMADEKLQPIGKLTEQTGRSVDLVDPHILGEPLLGQILKHGKVLLGSVTCYGDLIHQHLFDQADCPLFRIGATG